MKKRWIALLSMIGLVGAGTPVDAQVLKGSKPAQDAPATNMKSTPGSASEQKLQVKQQAVRQQGNTAGAVGQNTGTCGQLTKGNNQAITKGNQQITKGNQQITKGG